jgi:hypothetical protein
MSRKGPDTEHLIDKEITRQIIGAFFECYNHLGYGQCESVYRKALVHEMHLRGLSVMEETSFEVRYKNVPPGGESHRRRAEVHRHPRTRGQKTIE